MRIVQFTPTEDNPIPARSATRKGQSNIWFVFDDNEELAEGSNVLTPMANVAAVDPKNDLPNDHPLQGKRLIEPLPAGFPGDLEVKPAGNYVLHIDGEEVDYE